MSESKVSRRGERYLDLRGGRLRVFEEGPTGRRPLLLIHGFAGSLDVWDPMIEYLVREHPLVRVDLPGHGCSDEPVEDAAFSIAAQAAVVAEAMEELGLRDVIAVGHSAGGDVVTALIESHTSMIRGAVFLGTAPDLSFVHVAPTARLLRLPMIGPLLWRATSDAMVEAGLSRTMAPNGPAVPPVFVSSLRSMTYRSYVLGIRNLERYKNQRSLTSRLSNSPVPLLVMFGGQDQWVDPRAAESWATNTRARIEILDRIGHTHMAEAPEQTARLITEFAKSVVG